MNRHERRAAKAASRQQHVDRTVAVHEAGHAIARIMTANSLGWEPEKAVAHVEIHAEVSWSGDRSIDGRARLSAEAVTFGNMLSRPMNDYMRALPPGSWSGSDVRAWTPHFAAMRQAGIDLDWWFRARSIIAMFGPLAEARLLAKPFDDVWNGYEAEADVRDLVRDGMLCGMTVEEIIASLGPNATISERYMDLPGVWEAILAVADRLKHGRTPGNLVVRIAMPHLRVKS